MQRFSIRIDDLPVAHGAGLQVVGGPFYKAPVGLFTGRTLRITLVAGLAAPAEMGVPVKKGLVDDITFVHFFRPNRWRCSRSSFPFGGACSGRFIEHFYDFLVCVAGQATALVDGDGRRGRKDQEKEQSGKPCSFRLHHIL